MLAVSLLLDLLYYLIYFNIFKKVSFVLDTWFLFFCSRAKFVQTQTNKKNMRFLTALTFYCSINHILQVFVSRPTW